MLASFPKWYTFFTSLPVVHESSSCSTFYCFPCILAILGVYWGIYYCEFIFYHTSEVKYHSCFWSFIFSCAYSILLSFSPIFVSIKVSSFISTLLFSWPHVFAFFILCMRDLSFLLISPFLCSYILHVSFVSLELGIIFI